MASGPRCDRCGACLCQGRGGLMSEFVEQCRREWSRLGVADPLAEEMAADLTSDLEEAEAEGVSTAEYLREQRVGSRGCSRPPGRARARDRPRAAEPRRKGRRRPPRWWRSPAWQRSRWSCGRRCLLATGEPKDMSLASTTARSLRFPALSGEPPYSHPAPSIEFRQARPPRSSGSSCSSQSPRSGSLCGCGCAGAARVYPPPRLAGIPCRDQRSNEQRRDEPGGVDPGAAAARRGRAHIGREPGLPS